MATETTYIGRYMAGECEQVWAELVALGAKVGEEPLMSEAWAVACETMRRVRHNFGALVPRLRDQGYEFGHGWAISRGVMTADESAERDREEPPLSPSECGVIESIHELERCVGKLPFALRAFYEIVGGVNFVGSHPDWGSQRLDPVEILSAPSILQLDDWNRWTEDRQENGSCELPISPDEYHKYRYSGGGLYAIPVSGVVADAPLRYEWHKTTFVNYLRIVMRWAGLPGWERTTSPDKGVLTTLTHDLLPI